MDFAKLLAGDLPSAQGPASAHYLARHELYLALDRLAIKALSYAPVKCYNTVGLRLQVDHSLIAFR